MSKEEYIYKEKILSELEFNLISDLIRLRKESNYTQKQLAEDSCVIRELISKIENQIVSPQIKTFIKILEPLGYTLKIEKIDSNKNFDTKK